MPPTTRLIEEMPNSWKALGEKLEENLRAGLAAMSKMASPETRLVDALHKSHPDCVTPLIPQHFRSESLEETEAVSEETVYWFSVNRTTPSFR
ncbi:MAG: hypothetical protein WBF17_17090 [Phycisphaerae bacterium]